MGVAEVTWECGCDAGRCHLLIGIVLRSGGVCVRVNVKFVWGGAFVGCCSACGCVLDYVLELVVCRVRFARVSCPRLRFVYSLRVGVECE